MSNVITHRHTATPLGISLSKAQRDRVAQVRELVQGEFKGRGKELLDG